jgi:hypothetical protein
MQICLETRSCETRRSGYSPAPQDVHPQHLPQPAARELTNRRHVRHSLSTRRSFTRRLAGEGRSPITMPDAAPSLQILVSISQNQPSRLSRPAL